MIKFFLILSILPTLSLARQESAIWTRSLEFYQRQDFVRSKNLLLTLVRSNPKKAVYWFNLGNSYFMMKEYGRAITAYLKVEELASPLTPAAQLYRAKALKARGEVEPAQEILRALVARPGLPPALAEEASKDLMAEVDEDAVTAEALAHYRAGNYTRALRLLNRLRSANENQILLKAMTLIKLDRDDRAHDLLRKLESVPEMRGLVSTLLDRIRDTYSKPHWLFLEAAGGFETGPLAVADVGGGIRLWQENLWYLNSGYAFRTRQTPDYPEDRVLAHELRASLGRELGSELFLISPFFSHESWDGDAARSSAGALLRMRLGKPKLEWGAEAEFHRDSSLSGDYDYLSGSRQRYALVASRLQSPYFLRLQLFFARADVGDQTFDSGEILPAAYRGWGSGFQFLWRFRSQFVAEGSAYWIQRQYPTLSQPGSISRKDEQLILGMRLTRVISNRISAYLSLIQDKNVSTMDVTAADNQNFNRTQILVGVIWDVL